MSIARANTVAARGIVAGLAANGVRHAVVTPGSRSTPLVFAFADQQVVRPWLVIDERSAGFFALGLARATGTPVAIACTSGTAVANLFPAVAEANLSRIPLIALTADRPPRLRDVGAPQTMDQVHLFGRHVRWSIDLPVPTSECEVEVYQAAGMRAVQAALASIPGPVQLNIPFDEPLVEPPNEHPAEWAPNPGKFQPPEFEPSAEAIDEVLALAARAERPLIVAGPETGGLPAKPIADLAVQWGAPVVADPLSGLRAGVPPDDTGPLLDAVDAWLRDVRPAEPDFVLRFGASPTSKALNQFLSSLRGVPQVIVDLPGGYREPNAVRTLVLKGSPARVARSLCATSTRSDDRWLGRWVAADRAARVALDEFCAGVEEGFEGRVFAELGQHLPAGVTLVAGNSMPVRDLDNFLGIRVAPLDIVANRGVNGIDGVMSSAAGAAAAGRPTVVVVGDVSFLHDLNALWAAREYKLPLLAVVINNDGGGIFHYLPQVAHTARFERWFATPPRIDAVRAAGLFDLAGARIATWSDFRECLQRWLAAPSPLVIEIRTDRAANVTMHRRAWRAAAEAAREVFDS